MAWCVAFDPAAEGDFARLDRVVQLRIGEKLDWLLLNFANIPQGVPLRKVYTREKRE